MGQESGRPNESQIDIDRQSVLPTIQRRSVLQIGAGTGLPLLSGCLEFLGGDSGAITVNLTRLQIGQQIPWNMFDTLEINFKRAILHSTQGESSTVNPSNQRVNLTTLSTDDSVSIIDSMSVPPGEYKTADFYLPVTNAMMTDGSSVTFSKNEPLTIDTGGLGQYLTIEEGVTTTTLAIGPSQNNDGTWSFAVSINVPQ